MSFTRLTADLTAAGTTVTVESTAAFDSSGTLHLGRERITYSGKTSTTFTGCTRGTAGTKARAYSVAGAQIHRVYGQPSGATVECLPGVLGRRVTLWALSLSGGTATDPTLLYDGRIAKGAQALDSGAFELPIEHAAKALAQASAAPELTLYGWAHGGNARAVGATIVGSYYGSALWTSWAASDTEYHTLNNAAADPDNGGWSATLEQYVDRWNRAARTDGADVRASIRSDGGLSIQATDLVTDRRLVVWQGWTETARAYPGDAGDVAETAVVLTDVCPPCCLWLAGDVHLDSAALAQVPAVPSNPVYAGTGDAVYSYWTLACERDNRRTPKTRITSWISAVGASSVTCVALDHGSPDGFSRLESLLTKPTVATVGIWARSVTWWSGIRYGVFAQIESLRGLDHVSDSVDWTRVRTVAEQSSAHPTRREYVVDVSKPPLDLLRNEAFLAGCALATYHGRLSLVRIRDVAVTEARNGTLSSAHLRRGRVATLTEVASGLATAYKLRFPTGDVLSVQDAGAIA
ncbi:MAG TPA: hypothetical protein VFV33_19170, partial [Gemmatimonadaceae bacterium]|nr:hypothetical protein [Gemmatimonadaceae bacterium]